MFRSTLVNTMQLATWDFLQAGSVLPQCSCGEGEGERSVRRRQGEEEKEIQRDPAHPGKPHLLLGLGLLKSLFKVCYILEL